jgi:hypothetical protein
MSSEENSPAGLSEKLLTHSLAQARERAREIDQAISRLTEERDSALREIELLQELLAVRRGEPTDRDLAVGAAPSAGAARIPTRRVSRPHPAVVAAIAELEKAGRPMHISELMKALGDQGVRIPGSGQQANLIAHMMRNPQIVRPSRGMYALASWGIEDKPRVKPAVRRRVRGRSKASNRKAH